MQAIALAVALPTPSSHFSVSLSGGMNPVSSPPHAVVPAQYILSLLLSMRPSTVPKREARLLEFRHAGQSALILLELPVTASYLPWQSAAAGRLFSQLSS